MCHIKETFQIGHSQLNSERIDKFHANPIDGWSGYTNTDQRFQYEENIKGKARHYKIIEVSFHGEGLILNVYALNKNSKYKNQSLKELKGKLLLSCV